MYLWLVLLALAALLALPSSRTEWVRAAAREVVAPFQQAAAGIQHRTREAFANLGDLAGFVRSSDEMAKELFILRERLREVDALEQEIAELRGVLRFARQPGRSLIPAEVVGRRETTGWWRMLQLGKGRDDGILPDRPVLSFEGLVGRTLRVTRGTTDVLLLADRSLEVAAVVERVGADGILRGNSASLPGGRATDLLAEVNPLRLDYLDKDAEIRVHDRVVTAGLGHVFPPGVLIGSVLRYGMDPSGLYQYADVKPAVDFRSVRYVFVVAE